jgi:Tol biopolymer transport system component
MNRPLASLIVSVLVALPLLTVSAWAARGAARPPQLIAFVRTACTSNANGEENCVDAIGIVNTASGRARVIAQEGSDPCWSPDGRRIAYTSRGGSEIWLMNPDGSGKRRLVSAFDTVHRPAWSPNGLKLAFTIDRDGLYVINLDGTARRRLVRMREWFKDPAWSSRGQIAFGTGGGTRDELRVISASGNDHRRIAQVPWSLGSLAWSPDGRRIVTSSGPPEAIEVVSADGSNRKNLAAGLQPAWSPDGRRLAFWGGLAGVRVMNADGSNSRLLTSPGRQPAWSPNGRQIAFASESMTDDYDVSVYVVNAAGGPRRLVVGDASDPVWQPRRSS